MRLLLRVAVGGRGGGGPGPEQLHTDALFSAGEKCGERRTGGGQQVTQALSLDQGPFLGWKSRVRRTNVLLSPEEFPGLPSGRRAAQLPLLAATAGASSRLERPGATETPGRPVIRAGRK